MNDQTVNSVTCEEFHRIQSNGESVELIDVRPHEDFEALHAESARSVPFAALDPASFMAARTLPAEAPVYVICQAGVRSVDACLRFIDAGFENVINVEGGTGAWKKAGLPVVRGKKSVSIQRQVQMTAGSLVLIGVALGVFVHPGFYALSAFIGAGLLFSGASGTCAMGAVLARMPWNRRSSSAGPTRKAATTA